MEYHSYVIRLWRASAHAPWRISLRNTATGERKGFATLDEAAEYLSREIKQAQVRPAKEINQGTNTEGFTPKSL